MKKKKLNIKREEVKKQLKENPTVRKKDFDDLLNQVIAPEEPTQKRHD